MESLEEDSIAANTSQTLPSPQDLAAVFPLSEKNKCSVANRRAEIEGLLSGSDNRLMVICGPCSISDIDSALEYGRRLRELSEKVSDALLVMRVYVQKPRTTVGWKGFFYDPELDGSLNIRRGIFASRSLMIRLADLGLPLASEVVDPLGFDYFSDLISWACIGARTCESQLHREYASSLPFPIGIKNSTQGSLLAAAQGVLAVSAPHARLIIDSSGGYAVSTTFGNQAAHVVLRGGERPNYDDESLGNIELLLGDLGLLPRIVVDCSHGNSGKTAEKQPGVFLEVVQSALKEHSAVKGLMLESNLFWGNQKLRLGQEVLAGTSVTDPCIDWETTESLILSAASQVRQAGRSKKTLPKWEEPVSDYGEHSRGS